MAKMPDLKVLLKLDDEQFIAGAIRVRRNVTGMAVAMRLATELDPADVQRYFDEIEGPTKGREQVTLAWLEDHRTDWERMVLDGLAWLVAADEHVAIIKNPTED